jgi:ATP-dependent DNA helicase RecG
MNGDLAAVLGRVEHDALEFKGEIVDRNAVREAICALSNDLPGRGVGRLVLGVRNDGRGAGVDVGDAALQAVTQYRQEGRILPPPIMSVEAATFDGKDCIVVTVTASPSPPVRFDGVVWVRVGPTTRRATRDEERILAERRRTAERPFDEQPVAGSSLADLDLELFRSTYLPAAVSPDVIEENQRSQAEQLSSLRLATPGDAVPTVLGHLTIGLDPSDWIAGAYLQFVRYEGDDVAAPVQDHEELRGNLIVLLDTLNRLLPANIRTAIVEASALRQRDVPDYPMAALREVVVNALMHRTYESSNAPVRVQWFSDRVEVTSPGGPFGVVNASNFDRVNDYRNPALAAVLKELGYVNRFGRGIGLVRASLAGNGNPPPEFTVTAEYWGVILRAAR